MLSFVPYLGSLTVLVVSFGLAIVQGWPGWELPVTTLAVVLTGQFLEGNILSPRLVGASVGLHPFWVIFAVFAFGSLFGIVGLIVAVPVAAAAGVLLRFGLRRYLTSSLFLGDPQSPPPQITDARSSERLQA
ncbi:MAG TPA: AI-2E family transporter, partial [Beijerinckiaceae bacterium]|nr:AI-2E family transporter [Beijerinckiaceae bacterium]